MAADRMSEPAGGAIHGKVPEKWAAPLTRVAALPLRIPHAAYAETAAGDRPPTRGRSDHGAHEPGTRLAPGSLTLVS
jgi:hypothetical protein